jgi:predicted Zn finger-like uncharacterized protein
MTVRCPRCGTQYRRPTHGRAGPSETFRCARCRHVFDAEPEEPALVRGGDDVEEDDDVFTFGDEDEAPAPDERPARRGRRREAGADETRDAPAAGGGPSVFRFAVRSLLAVTALYGVLSIYLYTHPERTRELLERVPLVGQSLAERRLHPENIQLADVRGDYRRVKGDRLVFVITGTAINASPVPVRGIQVQGRLAGATEQRQVVFVGAAPPDVQELSQREIALLQTIEPSRDWALAPGEQATFLVAFTDPPADLREFSAEVVAVQAPRRPATPAPASVAHRGP